VFNYLVLNCLQIFQSFSNWQTIYWHLLWIANPNIQNSSLCCQFSYLYCFAIFCLCYYSLLYNSTLSGSLVVMFPFPSSEPECSWNEEQHLRKIFTLNHSRNVHVPSPEQRNVERGMWPRSTFPASKSGSAIWTYLQSSIASPALQTHSDARSLRGREVD
jgi:hypothetical protein